MGDIFLLTDNPILINKHRETKTINCIQKKAEKVKITEKELIKSNKNGFGNNVGTITNHVTAMFSVQAQFPVDSKEFKILDYRIKCGQIFQQNEIDKIKGIIAAPMPKSWYDNKANKIFDTDTDDIVEKKKLYSKIVADKKPYFFIYIYPQLKNEYKKFMDNVNKKCMIEFNCSLETLINKSYKQEKEREFIDWYYKTIPVEIHDCTMNRLCRIVEKTFYGYVSQIKKKEHFDYSIMKSDCSYDMSLYYAVKRIYDEYSSRLCEFVSYANTHKIDKYTVNIEKNELFENYKRKCEAVCNNKYELCNIVLDICYKSEKSKKFAWNICGDTIVENLLHKNNNEFSYFRKSEKGDICFSSERFVKLSGKINEE